ncbi:MAG TPA: 2-hydroxyacid dehydrogenase [Solirubrobacteraceae bacterium]|nr:2-hydroxyacid dehydrogenase [Solirubrobacteraceae bacterium]
MLVWVPDHAEADRLQSVEGAEVKRVSFDREPGDDPDRVEVIVPPPVGSKQVDFGGLPRLRLVQTLSAGVDRYAGRIPAGVTLARGGGVHDIAVSEWVLAVILASNRCLPEHRDDQHAHRWERMYEARELQDARVLIVGAGAIGQAVAERLGPFGSHVAMVTRTGRDGTHAIAELPSVLPDADVVVLLVPLTDETRGLLDADMLARMGDGALLVNAARGPVVVTEALEAELRAGRLRAALDVTDPEPLPPGHTLWDAPGLLLTPHVGGSSPRWVARGYDLVADQLERLREGRPLRYVVGDGGY